MEPQHLIRTVRRRWRPIVVLAVLGATLGFASSAVADDAASAPVPVTRYEACHSLLVDVTIPPNVDQWDVRNLAQLAQRVTQGAIPGTVAASVGIPVAELSARLRVVVRNDIQSVTICAVGETPAEVESVADGFATELLTFLDAEASDFHADRLENARTRVDDAQEAADAIETEIALRLLADPGADIGEQEEQASARRLELAQAKSELVSNESNGVPVVPIETLEEAEAGTIAERTYEHRLRAGAAGANVVVGVGDNVGETGDAVPSGSGSPIPDGPGTRGGVGGGLGAAMGFGWVMFTERLDSRLRRKDDVESTLDLPVLAEVPPLGRGFRRSTRVIALEEPRSRSAESYRGLRSALDYARMVDEENGRAIGGAQVVLITSAGPDEGKTTTLANLATVMAEGDRRRVLAVNCDFRRPRLHRYLGGSAEPQRLNATDVPGVQLVTQVTRSDSESTPSDVVEAQRQLVTRARGRYDVILLDTAPILTTNDASELLSVVDHVILAVSAGQTVAESAARAAELLERRGRPPLGVALIGARDIPNSSEYYYDDHDPYLEQSGRRRRSLGRDRSAVIDLASPTEVSTGG